MEELEEDVQDPAGGTPKIFIAPAVLSIIFSVTIFLSFWRFKQLRMHPSKLVLYRTMCDLVFACSLVAGAMKKCEGDTDQCTHCENIGALNHFSLLASQTWYFMITVDLILALRYPFTDLNKNVIKYHAFVWTFSAVMTICVSSTKGYGYRPELGTCWVNGYGDPESVNPFSWGFFYIPLLIFYVTSLVVTITAYVTFRKGLKETLEVRRKIVHDNLFYNGQFWVYWTVMAIVYISLALNDDRTRQDGMFEFLAIVLGLLGVLNDCMWIYLNFSIFKQWCGGDRVSATSQPFNTALRKEVLYFTTKGILEVIEKSRKDELLSGLPKKGGNVYSTEIQPSISSKHTYVTNYIGRTGDKVSFVGYSPQVFRFLRSIFNISSDGFEKSIRGSSNEDLMTEKCSEGRSASFFYFTLDEKFMVKTITSSEMKLLIKMLPYYAEYMNKQKNTLINRFVGLYSIDMYHQKVYYVVMESIFAAAGTMVMHERYDLKGSWVNRNTKDTRESGARGYNSKIMKDNDLHNALLVDSNVRAQVVKQGELDSLFLAQLGIMDYSLLVGISYVRKPYQAWFRGDQKEDPSIQYMSHAPGGRETSNTVWGRSPTDIPASVQKSLSGMSSEIALEMASRSTSPSGRDRVGSGTSLLAHDSPVRVRNQPHDEKPHGSKQASHPPANESVHNADKHGVSSFRMHHGGMRAEVIEGPGVYYMGIIDILQEYDWSKKLEHFAKTWILRKDRKGISCINEMAYQKRFLQKLKDITEPIDEDLA